MVFPRYGSWFSDVISSPDSLTNNILFVADYVTGSSSVEYAFASSSGSLIGSYAYATIGSNSLSVTSIGSPFRTVFRLVGYPSLGFAPKVTSFSYNQNEAGTIQTKNLGSDIKLPTTKFTNAYVRLEGDFYWLATGSVSSDAGSTWTPITNYNQVFTLTSATGSEPIIKVSDSTGSVVLTGISAYFHGSDVS